MRRHAPHASAMGKRDAGSDAPAKVSLLSFLSYRIIFDEINHQSFRPVVFLCEFGGSHMRKLLFSIPHGARRAGSMRRSLSSRSSGWPVRIRFRRLMHRSYRH